MKLPDVRDVTYRILIKLQFLLAANIFGIGMVKIDFFFALFTIMKWSRGLNENKYFKWSLFTLGMK